MKATLYRNIDLMRIPIKAGVSEYFFPQNVAWAGKKVDEIIVCAPATACIDPVDGVTPVMDASTIGNLYFNLYAADDMELAHDMSFEQIAHLNNNRIDVHTALNLSLSKMYFTSAPVSDCTLLIYVAYESKEIADYDMPQCTMTINMPLQADQEVSFRDVINWTIHQIPSTVKGIICWDAANTPAYITLRDHQLTYQMDNVHVEMMRPDMLAQYAYNTQAKVLWLDNLDIDFAYSRIRNASSAPTNVKLTFLY